MLSRPTNAQSLSDMNFFHLSILSVFGVKHLLDGVRVKSSSSVGKAPRLIGNFPLITSAQIPKRKRKKR